MKHGRLLGRLDAAIARIKELQKDLGVEIAINTARREIMDESDVVTLYHGSEVERLNKRVEELEKKLTENITTKYLMKLRDELDEA